MKKRKWKPPYRKLPKRETLEQLEAQPDLPEDEMLPDLGRYLLAQGEQAPRRFPLCKVCVLTPTGECQTDVVFLTQIGEQQYMGTLIVKQEMEAIQDELTDLYIRVKGAPSPQEEYRTAVGEIVVPLRGTFEVIPEERLVKMSMN